MRKIIFVLLLTIVSSIWAKSTAQQSDRLPSLCDEWNVLVTGTSLVTGGPSSNCFINQLKEDTIINGQRYVKLCDNHFGYHGAMREGDNRDIYYIPKESEKEYLLYAFNSKVGDLLKSLWIGCYGSFAYVTDITEGDPRIFTVEYYIYHSRYGLTSLKAYWIEGIGTPEGPDGGSNRYPFITVTPGTSWNILCAYKNGEQIYTSFLGEIIGCEYSGPGPFISTVPLFVGDGPGTSTVDPIDPNLIVAYLQNNMLVIKEFVGVEFYYALTNGLSPLMQARGMAPQQQQQSFRNEVSIPLTEPGVYTIELTSPEWDYSVTGTFTYMPQGIETVSGQETVAPVKILQNGQLFIIRSGKTFTLTGQEMK